MTSDETEKKTADSGNAWQHANQKGLSLLKMKGKAEKNQGDRAPSERGVHFV
jgi:hypothetical protein